jgi:hypothetical protein
VVHDVPAVVAVAVLDQHAADDVGFPVVHEPESPLTVDAERRAEA